MMNRMMAAAITQSSLASTRREGRGGAAGLCTVVEAGLLATIGGGLQLGWTGGGALRVTTTLGAPLTGCAAWVDCFISALTPPSAAMRLPASSQIAVKSRYCWRMSSRRLLSIVISLQYDDR